MGNLKINLIFIAIMLIIVGLVSGCFFVPQFPTQTQEDIQEYEDALEDLENQLEDLNDELEDTVVKDEDKDEEVKVVVSQPEFAIDDDVQNLLDNNNKLTSISYNYRAESAVDSGMYEIYLKGDMMKIILPDETNILHTLDMDTVIIDWGDRTAISYCASVKYCEETGEKGEVSIDKYYVMNPIFWLDKIDTAEKTEERKLFNRDATVADINGGEYVFWIENFYGVPLQVEEDGEIIAVFADAIFNRVDDSEMEFFLTDNN
ncbi:MAG: YtxH domain-containing protein [archaeon]|nr:YtxH domain-containing protein [Nanoarchaeota archaeon]